jgi:hypothetical protein
MKLSLYVPKQLEQTLRERADTAEVSPARYVQQLLKERLASDRRRFSAEFLALAGSWEDDRTADEILQDLKANRLTALRPELR